MIYLFILKSNWHDQNGDTNPVFGRGEIGKREVEKREIGKREWISPDW